MPQPRVPPERLSETRRTLVGSPELSSLGRKDASALAARLGGATADEVSAKTTMLVIGDEGFGPRVRAWTCRGGGVQDTKPGARKS
jgi:BRCT domain type II-containing protein